MRQPVLNYLFSDLTRLRGVGDRWGIMLQRLCGRRIIDLIFHLPVGIVDRRYTAPLRLAEADRIITLKVRAVEHAPPRKKTQPWRVVVTDQNDDQLIITLFKVKNNTWIQNAYPTNEDLIISGLLEKKMGIWTMNRPDYVLPAARASDMPSIEAIWPLTAGITTRNLRRIMVNALNDVPELAEWHDTEKLQHLKWPSWRDALNLVHKPEIAEKAGDINATNARMRLAFDEALADQLALAIIRRRERSHKGHAISGNGQLVDKLLGSLPFSLTDSQREAWADIHGDMSSSHRMLRLLQGDVGAGKTIVALMAMLTAIESGCQAALMAPTALLATQHYRTISRFLEPVGVPIALLVSRPQAGTMTSEDAIKLISQGQPLIVIGTHALIQERVDFPNLGIVVVDEQHRFGVRQRLSLAGKGNSPDILMMTATPIPRTLALTAYGDMDISTLRHKPQGRKPIDTRLVNGKRLGEVIDALRRHVEGGGQAYWICPLVEESEKLDLAAATEREADIRGHLGEHQVALVHGRISTDIRDQIMQDFATGKVRVLIATTVVEVGVDVPAATLMIIEHAERFGLSQLHQLRGRVGRGSESSVCLLVYHEPLNPVASERLKSIRNTEDGFIIAEADMRLRGAGEILGTKQSGVHIYRLASTMDVEKLANDARIEAESIIRDDPMLKSPRGHALRILLYLFEKDEAARLLLAG